MDNDVIIVSGLPRSGTSLMMQMLDSGGIPVLTDQVRTPDTDNPRGYYEFERVKKTRQDPSWLAEARGKAVKMVSQLLYDLPAGERYRVLFMERNLEEVLRSQEKMLARLGRPAAPREPMKQAYLVHLERLHDWLRGQPHFRVLRVNYPGLIEQPRPQAQRVCDFLNCQPDVDGMVRSVDPLLYRNR